MLHNQRVGKTGEIIALGFIKKKGFTVVASRVTSHWGEIDIIAKEGDHMLHFIEVKTRTGTSRGKPHESVTPRKIHSLKRAIQYYLLKNKIKGGKLSLDVISIVLETDMTVRDVRYYENIDI